jgi:hypothetical protein
MAPRRGQTVNGQDAQWDPGWVRSAGPGQDGAAELWVAVFADDGTFMGAAPCPATPGLVWRDGRLCLVYSPVLVTMRRAGRYQTGVICAVMRGARQYRPLWPVSLGTPHELRAGDSMTILDGIIAITPDVPVPAMDTVNAGRLP